MVILYNEIIATRVDVDAGVPPVFADEDDVDESVESYEVLNASASNNFVMDVVSGVDHDDVMHDNAVGDVAPLESVGKKRGRPPL